MITLSDLLALAYAHARRTGNESAMLCCRDAERLSGTPREVYARGRLLDSLKYSIGICHTDYTLATAESFEVVNRHTGEVLPGAAMTYEQAKGWIEAATAAGAESGFYRVQPYSAWETARQHPQDWRD